MKNKGFTLLELSMVIVVIGLLVVGLVEGKALLHSAELREIIGDYDRYSKSIKEFQDKYQALPGDMSNAETIWGSDSSCPTTATNSTPKIATCNGNGNGRIGASSSAGVLDTSAAYEWFRAWQQLANAGMIPGQFTGVKETATDGDAGPGVNVPKAKMKAKAGWTLFYFLQPTTDVNLWGDQYGHMFSFGGDTTSITNNPVLSPQDAMSIDQKIDDGKPASGFIRAWRTNLQSRCTDNDTSASVVTYGYYISEDSCSLLFILGF